MKKIFLIAGVALLIGLTSCENEIDPGQNSLMKMSNEWWGQIYVPNGSGGLTDIGQGYQHLLTSNTSSGTSDSLFVDDFNGLLQLKAKVACNINDLTFTTNGVTVLERYTEGTVVIGNGRIYQDGGKSTSGVKVDSIYFEAEFDWDPGQIYVIAGHGRTGFDEDEH
jgi:Lipid-binding putative hydrolase